MSKSVWNIYNSKISDLGNIVNFLNELPIKIEMIIRVNSITSMQLLKLKTDSINIKILRKAFLKLKKN